MFGYWFFWQLGTMDEYDQMMSCNSWTNEIHDLFGYDVFSKGLDKFSFEYAYDKPKDIPSKVIWALL